MESLFSAMKYLEGIVTEGVDEFLSRSGESVEVVDVSKQEPCTSFDGACLLSMLGGAASELIDADGPTSLDGSGGGPRTGLVGAQYGGDDEVSDGLGQGLAA